MAASVVVLVLITGTLLLVCVMWPCGRRMPTSIAALIMRLLLLLCCSFNRIVIIIVITLTSISVVVTAVIALSRRQPQFPLLLLRKRLESHVVVN